MITFDNTKMLVDLRNLLRETIILLQHEVLSGAEGRMFTPEGRADIEALPVEELTGIILTSIVEGPWAIMDEFGKGSTMDTQNPFLAQYRNSSLWNPSRHDLVIRGRPAGSYVNIFGETKRSSGRADGADLERIADIAGKENYRPRPPSQALQTAMRWMAGGRFQKAILSVLETFPWGNYLTVSG